MRKRLIGIMLFLILFLITIVPCFANDDGKYGKGTEKILTAELKKDYEAAKFNIKFDEEGDYEITISEPNEGESYNAPLSSKTEASCVVTKPVQGTWTIHILKRPTTTTDEDGNEVVQEASPIGGVHVEIQGSTHELTNVDNDIKVAADISGLKMYFRDQTFVAEWAESNKGSMYIEIVDAKTQEKLVSDTSEGHSFELDIDPHLHDNIVVTIVPEESSRIDNAERRWTLTTKNEPDISFVFPQERIMNWDKTPVDITLGSPYKIEAYLNNRIIMETDILPAGKNTIELDTDIGENSYILYSVAPDTGYMKSVTYSIIKDVIAPAIKLNQSYENITTDDESITFEGSIDPDYQSFTINDTPIKVEGDHTFAYNYELKEGINNIRLYADDEAGNVAEYNASITRIIPEVAKIPWAPIIIGCSLAGLAITYIVMIFVKRRRNEVEAEDDLYDDDETNDYDDDNDDDDDDDDDMTHKNRKNGRTPKKNKKRSKVLDPRLSFALRVIIPAGCVFIMFHYIIALTTVASGSMIPKLPVGNLAVYNRLAYKQAEPERGDIILFYSNELNETMAKRIIGIPGDEISFIDGFVFINGQRVDESEYIKEELETNCAESFTVPERSVFVMGDNRENSYDSRFLQQPYISYDNIIGKFMGQSRFNIKYAIEQRLNDNREVKAAEPSNEE